MHRKIPCGRPWGPSVCNPLNLCRFCGGMCGEAGCRQTRGAGQFYCPSHVVAFNLHDMCENRACYEPVPHNGEYCSAACDPAVPPKAPVAQAPTKVAWAGTIGALYGTKVVKSVGHASPDTAYIPGCFCDWCTRKRIMGEVDYKRFYDMGRWDSEINNGPLPGKSPMAMLEGKCPNHPGDFALEGTCNHCERNRIAAREEIVAKKVK